MRLAKEKAEFQAKVTTFVIDVGSIQKCNGPWGLMHPSGYSHLERYDLMRWHGMLGPHPMLSTEESDHNRDRVVLGEACQHSTSWFTATFPIKDQFVSRFLSWCRIKTWLDRERYLKAPFGVAIPVRTRRMSREDAVSGGALISESKDNRAAFLDHPQLSSAVGSRLRKE
ncbi:hypothetical protein JTE90_019256 [Oedothorax gibbosus]|uniref:Uncharacterized protein n=1 Tax=Oedothorax gibbosus TaxID=931172 RepID=A0AAV6UU24_9ARAC|nr:hypothetical protein JTE90_019256 [Oedothorax gibbosus]